MADALPLIHSVPRRTPLCTLGPLSLSLSPVSSCRKFMLPSRFRRCNTTRGRTSFAGELSEPAVARAGKGQLQNGPKRDARSERELVSAYSSPPPFSSSSKNNSRLSRGREPPGKKFADGRSSSPGPRARSELASERPVRGSDESQIRHRRFPSCSYPRRVQ